MTMLESTSTAYMVIKFMWKVSTMIYRNMKIF